jgi:hypothetical protein
MLVRIAFRNGTLGKLLGHAAKTTEQEGRDLSRQREFEFLQRARAHRRSRPAFAADHNQHVHLGYQPLAHRHQAGISDQGIIGAVADGTRWHYPIDLDQLDKPLIPLLADLHAEVFVGPEL